MWIVPCFLDIIVQSHNSWNICIYKIRKQKSQYPCISSSQGEVQSCWCGIRIEYTEIALALKTVDTLPTVSKSKYGLTLKIWLLDAKHPPCSTVFCCIDDNFWDENKFQNHELEKKQKILPISVVKTNDKDARFDNYLTPKSNPNFTAYFFFKALCAFNKFK